MVVEKGKNTKQKILEGTFDYLVKNGLENTSIRDVCKHIGVLKGSVYYYYKNKDELLCAAAEYGLKKMSDDIFSYFYDNFSNIDKFFSECTKSIDYVKNELRFIYQMAASPVYGEIMRNNGFRLINAYDVYAENLAQASGGDIKEIRPIIYIFAATIIDYALWQDREETQIQLNYLCKKLKEAMKAARFSDIAPTV